jgi:hypothetical protein
MYKWHLLKMHRNAHKSSGLNSGVFDYPQAENRAINGVLNTINHYPEGCIPSLEGRGVG